MDSDEEETFITIGTAQDIPSEDEPLRKPLTQQDLQAKDNKGRARFHGAFTGGFSAGYFNSVGSKEGWAPSTFLSSREKRAEHGQQQRPEDFMDDADVGEFGIAPRKVVTASTFASEERKRRRHDEAKLATSASALPGHSALLDLIVPERITIGVKLLRKMGWKEGQGVGPRLKKKEKRKKRAGMKTYGCELPPSPDSDADDDLDDETFLSDVTFAPEDTSHISLSAKDNTHGLGYRGLNPQMALPSTHINLFEAPTVRKAGTRKGIRGQGFGVGALEEEDEDIYAADDMSRYDMTMGGDEDDNNFGWTAPSSKGRGNTPVGYVGKLLEGFKLSSTKLVQKKDFPPPQLPRNYRPVHVFKKPDELEQLVPAADRGVDYRQFLTPTYNQDTPIATPTIPPSTQSSNQPKQYKDAVSRSIALGEKAFVGSVFDLVPKEDKEKMEGVRKNDASSASASSNIPSSAGKVPQSQEVISPPEPSQIPIEEPRRQNVPLFQAGGTSFKPFAKNPEKQERYEKYLALMKQGHREPYSGLNVPAQTEWEGEREKEEFAKAALLYRPLTGMMAMRFTTGKQTDDDTNVDVKLDESDDLSEADKAAQMKMYGKLTREVVQWHPDRLLCKRFNVPDPYPGSNIVGLATVKRDKYSVFTFLNFENPTSSAIQTIENSSSQKQESSKERETNIETETDKTESRVDKELNKSKNMKSIFSHLVDTENKVQKVTKGVSFSMKSTKTNKPKEFKSIFSHLEEEGVVSSVKKYVAMNTGENNDKTAERDVHEVEVKQEVMDISEKKATDKVKENKKDKKEDKGSDSDGSKLELDLFHAIFKNTDSEDSSSSEEEEITTKKKAGQNDVGTTVPDVDMSVDGEEEDTNRRETASVIKGKLGLQTLPENYSNSILERLPPAQHNLDCDSYGPTLPPPCTSGRVGLGTLPGDDVKIESIADRLSPASHSSDSESYGPALPPPFTAGKLNETTTSSTFPSSSYIDLTQESPRKHRHKDKHKLKKDKKEKHKKGKHKKKQKKKERKKRKRNDISNSSDTSDKDSDDEEPNDKELLNKLKTLKSRQRLQAVDFM